MIDANDDEIEDFSLEFDEIPIQKKTKREKKETDIYIKPEDMWNELRNYYLSLGDNYDWNEQKIKDKSEHLYPEFPKKLADMINEIADRMTYLPNFIQYSWKPEMVGDAILKMVKAVRDCSFKGYSTDKIIKTVERNDKKYFYHYDRRNKLREKPIKDDAFFSEENGETYITYKSDPFNYYTGISANAFINRIKKEKQAAAALDAFQQETWEKALATEQFKNVRRPKIFDNDENEVFYDE